MKLKNLLRLISLFAAALMIPTIIGLASTAGDVLEPPLLLRISQHSSSRLDDLDVVPLRTLDYGTYQWIEVSNADYAILHRSGVIIQEASYELSLGGYEFDPLSGYPRLPTGWESITENNSDLRLVQVVGPTRQAWLNALQSDGLEIVQYIHPFTYVVWADSTAMQKASGREFVRWSSDFAPAFRVLPGWRNLPDIQHPVSVLLYRGADTDLVISRIQTLGSNYTGRGVLNQTWEVANFLMSGAHIREAAQIPGVYSIQLEKTDGGLRGEMSDQINVTNYAVDNEAFPGYLTWLGAAGVDGSNVIIANVDAGVDNNHPDLVNRMLPCTGTTCAGVYQNNHGTHTAGIMAADGASGELDPFGFLRGLGMAPGANLVEQVYNPYFTWPNGMLMLMTESYTNGASLSGNSWGPSGTALGYDDDTMQVDIGVRDAVPDTSGNQSLSYILSIMNGSGGVSTQGTPDEAKNIFTIGSTKMQASDGSQILAINDLSANTAHGPALDGRKIPHMVAPGCSVDSTIINSYGLMCGTSMASPHVSGSVALFIEYYRGLFGVDPSPAMVKAAFLPVAFDLAGHLDADGGILGHPFDSKQGWGRMNTAAVISPTVGIEYMDNPVIFSNTGETWERSFSPLDPNKPVRIMLVWTDAPGHGLGGSTPAWNNDLDLVINGGETIYYGNSFAADGWSQSGGTPDYMNNTEGIFLGPTPPEEFAVMVVAANINSDGIPNFGDDTDQDFALVCYNCTTLPDFTLSASPTSQSICSSQDAIYEIEIESILGYSETVTLSAAGNPIDSSASFSINPVTPPGTSLLTIANTSTAEAGSYSIDIIGTAPTRTHTTTVGLDILTLLPGDVTLLSPLDEFVDIDLEPTFEWTSATQASSYVLEIATDDAFSNLVYVVTLENTTHTLSSTLNAGITYYWRVRSQNACGDGSFSATFSFTTLTLPCILLVDDDNNSPDVRSQYMDALDTLGYSYDVFDVGGGDGNGPDSEELLGYKMVLWFSGDKSGDSAGPNATDETNLAAYLDAGGNLFLSSQDYLADFGLTSFGQDYLGIAAFEDNEGDATTKYGMPGDPIGSGLGPYPLSYPDQFTNNRGDLIYASPGTSIAFRNSTGGNILDIDKESGNWKTVFFGTSWVLVNDYSTANGTQLLGRIVEWFGGCEPQIDLSKTVGTDPNTCATTDNIAVSAGSEVTYCYQATNIGTLTFTLHDLVDSELGAILVDFPSILKPGESVSLLQSTTILTDTINTATWTAYAEASGVSAVASDVASVTVITEIVLNKTVGTDPNTCATTDSIEVPAGSNVTYCYALTNTSERTFTLHDLVDSNLGTILDGSPYVLGPGESVTILQPTTILTDTLNTATWTAYVEDGGYSSISSDSANVTILPQEVEERWFFLPIIFKD
jgi:serine protease AprX